MLVIALLPYLLVEELLLPSASWPQPAMKGFALLMLAYYVALLIARSAFGGFRDRRRLRHEAHELLSDVDSAVSRDKSLDAGVRERIVAQASSLDAARLRGEPGPLQAEIQKLTQLATGQLRYFRKNATTDLVVGLAKALVVAFLIRTVLIEPYRIPSGSMIPTLEVGDQIFVNKYLYGVRLPLLNWVPFVIVRAPARGDVIVFENPVQQERSPIFRDDYIKRVAGIPGDRIELIDKEVYVNGVPQPRKLISDDYLYWDFLRDEGWLQVHGRLFEERLAERPHAVMQNTSRIPRANEGPFIVPPGHVFVMGDNRDNSLDSRYGLGALSRTPAYVPYGNIKGKAMIIWLSLAHGGLFSSFTGGAGFRTDRLFRPIR